MGYRILLVDDDEDVLSINQRFFQQLDYLVDTAKDSAEVKAALANHKPDCIVLDVMLPGQDGFSLCQFIKQEMDVPIIFLTGKDSEDDKVHGLLLGADDYMVKPYSLRELEVRIQVLIKRYKRVVTPSTVLDYPPLRIDTKLGKAYCNDQEIALSKKEFSLLLLLAEAPRKVFTFEEIGTAIWGTYLESDRRTIMVTASRMRKKLDSYPGMENCVETEWSQGYKFVPR